jgi:hypothetical protein
MGTGGYFPGGKAAGAWSWTLTSNYCRGQENMDVYIHSPIRLHVVVLEWISTGTTLPLPYAWWGRFFLGFCRDLLSWSGIEFAESLLNSCLQMLQFNSRHYYVIIIVMVIIVFCFVLVLFVVIKYLFWRCSPFFSNAQSLNTPAHHRSIEDETKEPATNTAIFP